MRWGVRQSNSSGDSKSSGSDDHKSATAIKQKTKKGGGTKSLSNKELQDLITRMNLERQYQQLNPSFKKQAGKFVADTLLNIGKQQATKLATDIAVKQLTNLLKR